MTTLIERLAELAEDNNHIDPGLYKEHEIARGLRNPDGKRVPAFLTGISAVIGEEDGKPVDGRLTYRGIGIEELVNGFQAERRYGFEETAYLLMFGKLPNEAELQEFSEELAEHRALHPDIVEHVIRGIPNEDIMTKLWTAVGALAQFDTNRNSTRIDNVVRQSIELIAAFPTIVAYSYLAQQGKTFPEPNKALSTVDGFVPLLGYIGNSELLYILDMMLVLHADHGANNSTFNVRSATSTGTDTYSAIAAGIASLKGPLHGGANASVMGMMAQIQKNVRDWTDDEEIAAYLREIISGNGGDRSGRVYGAGHAIYTISDPRAVILEKVAGELAGRKNKLREFNLLLKVAELTPGIVLEKKGKVVGPNVDYFSGFIYDCFGLPEQIFPPLFAMARSPGWLAHRIEALINDDPLVRPNSVYVGVGVGPGNGAYVPLKQR